MNARYYDPQLGQFISPDTLVPDATQLMDFNRYAYARGNPMKYNDPTGHCVEPVSGVICVLAVVGAALLLQGDNTTYQPTQADINSQRVGGSMLTAAAGLLGLETLFGSSAAATAVKAGTTTATTACADGDCTNEVKSTSQLVPEIGRKLEYMLGNATGSEHNIDRSVGMLQQLESIDLSDTAATRNFLTGHLTKVLNDPSNIVKIQENGRVVRESLLMGPQGGLKLESVWEANKLITMVLHGSTGAK